MPGYAVPASAFDGVAGRFTDTHTCVAIDHRGSGRSPAGWPPMSTRTMALDALSVLHHLGIESAHALGVSLGGMVAQELAIRAPQHVRSLILVSTTAGGVTAESPPLLDLAREARRAASQVRGRFRLNPLGAARQGCAAAAHDTTTRLRQIQVPTLVLHGSGDDLVPASNVRWLAAHIPRAEHRVIPGGHLLILDSPTASQVLAEWLDAHASCPPSIQRTDADPRVKNLTTSTTRILRDRALPLRRLLKARPRLH
jgi:3-oxoadipate enol-lactonase